MQNQDIQEFCKETPKSISQDFKVKTRCNSYASRHAEHFLQISQTYTPSYQVPELSSKDKPDAKKKLLAETQRHEALKRTEHTSIRGESVESLAQKQNSQSNAAEVTRPLSPANRTIKQPPLKLPSQMPRPSSTLPHPHLPQSSQFATKAHTLKPSLTPLDRTPQPTIPPLTPSSPHPLSALQ